VVGVKQGGDDSGGDRYDEQDLGKDLPPSDLPFIEPAA
jgi:hypothetical protein